MAEQADSIFLTHSLKPFIHLAAAGICLFFALGWFYDRNMIPGVAASVSAIAFLLIAFRHPHPKALLDGTVLHIREPDGSRTQWDLRDITYWEIIPDSKFDGEGRRGMFRGSSRTNDNPGIALGFPGGKRVVARCYFDRKLQLELVGFCVRHKRDCVTGKPQFFAEMYVSAEPEIIALLKRVS